MAVFFNRSFHLENIVIILEKEISDGEINFPPKAFKGSNLNLSFGIIVLVSYALS